MLDFVAGNAQRWEHVCFSVSHEMVLEYFYHQVIKRTTISLQSTSISVLATVSGLLSMRTTGKL